MTILTNTFEGWTDGQNITVAGSGGASGDAFQFLVINNVSTPSGSSAIQAKTAAAVDGTVGCRITLAAATTYLRWSDAQSGSRFVVRRSLKIPSTPSADALVVSIRNSTAVMVLANVDTSRRLSLQIASGFVSGSTSVVLTAGTQYWIEVAVTKESGGGSNGQVEYKITDASGTLVDDYASAATLVTGTGDATQYRLGGATTASGWTTDDFDTPRYGPVAGVATWIGPVANVAPTQTLTANQTVAAGATVTCTSTASDSDGTIASYAWTGTRYTVGTNPAAFTPTNSTLATCSYTAGSAGELVVLQCVVTDNGGATDTDTTEVRVSDTGTLKPLRMDGTGDAGWTIIGGSTYEGTALNDGSNTTRVESPDIDGTTRKKKWRLAPSGARTSFRITLEDAVLTGSISNTNKVRVITGGSTTVTTRNTSTLKKTSDNSTSDVTTSDLSLYLDLTAPELAALTDWGYIEIEAEVHN